MNCTPTALMDAARCWCLPANKQRSAVIYLLCEWLKNHAAPVNQITWSPDTTGGIARVSGVITPFTDLTAFRLFDPATVTLLVINPATPFLLNSISGIQYLPNLTNLQLFGNRCPTIDVSGMALLTFLDCSRSPLQPPGIRVSNLNVTGCIALQTLLASINSITTIDLSTCTSLTNLRLSNNNLSGLNLTGLASLSYLECAGNNMGILNITGCFALATMWTNDNTALVVVGP